MSYEEFKKLHERCTLGDCTPQEQKLFEEYRDKFDLSDIPWRPEFGNRTEIEQLLKKDLQNRLSKGALRLVPARWWAAAAIVIFTLSGLFVADKYFNSNTKPYQLADKNFIKPGSNKAILTITGGKQIILDGAAKGELFTLNHVSVQNNADSSITYQKTSSKVTTHTLSYNTLTTPLGGKYQLILADGTKVWLNAGSTIKYPVDFISSERSVELSGEAYFEVAHNSYRPFKVIGAGQVVQVLGTHFNINAYADEDAVKTTLLQGSVKVYTTNMVGTAAEAIIIKPNEQAVFKNALLSKAPVDADEFTAWKSGVILFRNADIHDVMRKISRWYNVDVEYHGQMLSDTYNGEIPRNAAFSDVLKILKLDDINVKVSGRKLIVSQ